MPFKSKKQMRWMFAAEERGEVPKGTARRWARETPNIKNLPEKKKEEKKAEYRKFACQLQQQIKEAGGRVNPNLIVRLLERAAAQQARRSLWWKIPAGIGLVGAGAYGGYALLGSDSENARLQQEIEKLKQQVASAGSPATPSLGLISALGGGAVGAGLGALYGLSSEEEKVDPVHVLTGGLTGLGAGFVLSYLL